MKYIKSLILAALIIAVIACDMPMGMGDPIDFEAPELKVTHIELPDGEIKPIDSDDQGRIYIGPGILFGKGALLKGKARDNVAVEEIQVLDKSSGIIWKSHDITEAGADGWQDWSIALEGLEKGEREVEITALDKMSLVGGIPNIGPNTVVQLTLLVDTNPPLVDSIYIERHPGIYANLLPLSILNELSPDNYDDVDYFQNEKFTIRAEISHEYSLDQDKDDEGKIIIEGVTLNLIDSNGNKLFDEEGLQRNYDEGTIYTPSWEIKASDFSYYNTGRHNFRVQVKARAKAGHFGQNDITTDLYSLCWFPEADAPRIFSRETAGHTIYKKAGSSVAIQIFDDDDLEAINYTIVSYLQWEGYKPGQTNEQKLRDIPNELGSFAGLNIAQLTPVQDKRLRNKISMIPVGDTQGEYRLIIVTKDKNALGGSTTVSALYTIIVEDSSIPPCDLIAIDCENPDGIYNKGDLVFRMLFSGEVKGTAKIKFEGGAGGNTGEQEITLTADASNNTVLKYSWTITSGLYYLPITITEVDLTGVKRLDSYGSPPSDSLDDSNYNIYNNTYKDLFNSERNIIVKSIPPKITHINGIDIDYNTTLDASILSTANNSLTLTFDCPVWPESGIITIRTPADSNYLVPPVLTTPEYQKINNSALAAYYDRTTHGLERVTRNNDEYSFPNTGTVYAPDIVTKYVLKFNYGVDNTAVRTILNAAEFNWRKIDVFSTTGWTIANGGTAIIVPFEALPNGQFWEIEIPQGTFRDAAGNASEPLGTGTDTVERSFWSSRTATPVIRIERLSHNDAHEPPIYITHTDGVPSGADIKYSDPTETLPEFVVGKNVRYRIDCVTPGIASLRYATERIADTTRPAITNTMSNPRTFAPGTLTAMSAVYDLQTLPTLPSADNYTLTNGSGNALVIGDDSLYKAEKNYIASTAKHSRLDTSAVGLEGAFKTIIVYRNFRPGGSTNSAQTNNATGSYNLNTSDDRFIKIEGSAGIISGFPLKSTDMTGEGSMFAYRNRNYSIRDHNNSTLANNTDWIWITWEAVSGFGFQSCIEISDVQNTPLHNTGNNAGQNSWANQPEDWYTGSFNFYGNWVLRYGHWYSGDPANPSSNRP